MNVMNAPALASPLAMPIYVPPFEEDLSEASQLTMWVKEILGLDRCTFYVERKIRMLQLVNNSDHMYKTKKINLIEIRRAQNQLEDLQCCCAKRDLMMLLS